MIGTFELISDTSLDKRRHDRSTSFIVERTDAAWWSVTQRER